MNMLVAMKSIDALISVSTNAIMAAQKWNEIAQKAKKENRDITNDEIAALKAQSDALTEKAIAILKGSNNVDQ